jgi:hypothetical protein
MRDQSARRSVLSVGAADQPHSARFATTCDYYQLLIRNTGNKTSRDVYWRIFLAEDVGNVQAAGGRDLGPITLDGVVYRQLVGSFRRPIFPARTAFIVSLKAARTGEGRRRIAIRWALVSEDGRVPEDESAYGNLTIDSAGVQADTDQGIGVVSTK